MVILDSTLKKDFLLPSLHRLHLQVTMESPFIHRVIASKAISNTGPRKAGKRESS